MEGITARQGEGVMKTRHEVLMEDPEYRRLYAIEGLIADAAELVARLMEEQGVNKAELARRLGKSRAWVTQLLSGKANMTMRTFAEVVHALGAQVKLGAETEETGLDQPAPFQSRAAALWRAKSGPSRASSLPNRSRWAQGSELRPGVHSFLARSRHLV